ncbi:hypothetical protein L1987_30624 [Smallanthus sonchifolius]|uniref:Uncharacterized protein n=1 Tax=Smallanthus sonchifolius TaxID=185202 RepID=A0ACB9I344_9ASTR|nr:hypothetical protein L1987_30624 [Smallanthus sonchifolius]
MTMDSRWVEAEVLLLHAGHQLLLVQESVLDLHTLIALRNLTGQVKLLPMLLRIEKMSVVVASCSCEVKIVDVLSIK